MRTSLLAAVVGVHGFQSTRWTVAGEVGRAQGNHHASIAPYGLFHCADGFVQIAVGSEGLWRRFCAGFDLDPATPGLETNGERVANHDRLIELVEGVFAGWKALDLLARLDEIGVPAGKVRTIDEVYALGADPQPGAAHRRRPRHARPRSSSPVRRCGSSTRTADEVTRTAHTAPPTLDGDGAAIRAWLARRHPLTARLRTIGHPRMEAAVQPFVINSHGRMVFPSNFLPELDFTVIDDLDQLDAVIRRDFEAKAPSGTEILRRIEAGDHYSTRYELMRDVALNLFWTNRFAMTMYDKRPTRWRDVPRHREDVFLPVLTPWEDAERKVAAVAGGLRVASGDLGRRRRGPDLPGAVRRAAAPAVPRHRAAGRQAHGRRDPRRARAASPTPWRPTTPTTRSTATSRSWTAARTSPSWRRCTAGRWSCTTSTRGTARRPG